MSTTIGPGIVTPSSMTSALASWNTTAVATGMTRIPTNETPYFSASSAPSLQFTGLNEVKVELNATGACVPEGNLYTIVFLPLILLSLLFNVILFAAATMDRIKLQRQNYLFACVSSTLLSNVVYLIFFIWILVDNYFEAETEEVTGYTSLTKYVWVFQEAGTLSIPFVICWNIVTLIHVTVNSATYVGRVAKPETNAEDSKKKIIKTRRIARIFIFIAWAIPLAMIILGMTIMNCVEDCRCPTTNFVGKLCPQDNCSIFWAPMSRTFIHLIVAIWFLAIVVVCSLVGYAIWRYQKTTQKTTVRAVNQANMEDPINDDEIIPEQITEEPVTHDDIVASHNETVTTQMPAGRRKTNLKRKKTRRSLRHRLNSRLRFALSLTVVYVSCSALFIIAIFMDTVSKNIPAKLSFGLSRLTMYLYTTVCPIIMVIHLPVLKSSLLQLFQKFRSCCKRKTLSPVK